MDKAIDLSLDSDTEQHCSPTSPPSSEIIDVDERTGDCGSSASGKRPCASVGTSEKKGNKRAKADGKGKGKCKDERKTRSPLFRLISTSHDGPGAGTVSMEDLLSGDFTELLLANFMIDIAFLLDAQPRLASVPVVIVHGFEKGSEPAERLRNVALKINLGIKVHTPEVPNFGKHHGKLMLIKFATGIRVIVTTANFIEYDTVGKSQGVWYQDFPRRQAEACEFEDVLVDYVLRMGGPATPFARSLREYDFTSARVALVSSVPCTRPKHKGADLYMYGHMRVRALLKEEPISLEKGGHKVIFQFSSLAHLSADPRKWLLELLSSFMAEKKLEELGSSSSSSSFRAADPRHMLEEHLRIVWPTTESVRTSLLGWRSGGSIPCRTVDMFGGDFRRADERRFRENKPKDELRPLLRKWEGREALNREKAAPHIKTFLRYRETRENGEARVDGDKLAWFLLTSSNLSRSAWGILDKTCKQLLLRSFEIGVMFLPSRLRCGGVRCSAEGLEFTCTPGRTGLTQRFPLAYVLDSEDSLPLELLPIPYHVPAPRYDFTKGDRPWVWDQEYQTPDAFGTKWSPGGDTD